MSDLYIAECPNVHCTEGVETLRSIDGIVFLDCPDCGGTGLVIIEADASALAAVA